MAGNPSVTGGFDNQDISRIHNRTVLTEHEIDIGDVTLRESREFSHQTSLTTGEHFRTVTVHTRAIGDRIYQVKEIKAGGGDLIKTVVNTTLEDDEIAQFNSDWATLWKPTITREQLAEIENTAVEFQPVVP